MTFAKWRKVMRRILIKVTPSFAVAPARPLQAWALAARVVSGCGHGDERDRGRRQRKLSRLRGNADEIRNGIVGIELERNAIQVNGPALQFVRRKRVSFAGHGHGEHSRSGFV